MVVKEDFVAVLRRQGLQIAELKALLAKNTHTRRGPQKKMLTELADEADAALGKMEAAQALGPHADAPVYCSLCELGAPGASDGQHAPTLEHFLEVHAVPCLSPALSSLPRRRGRKEDRTRVGSPRQPALRTGLRA